MATKRTVATTPSSSTTPPALANEHPSVAEIQRILGELSAMGSGEVAYMRKFRAADLHAIFPQTAELHPSVQLYALFGADGAPLMLADSREAIVSGAWQNDLAMIALN